MRLHVRQTAVVFVIPVAALLLSFIAAYRTTSQIVEGEAWVVHTYSVMGSLDKLEIALRQAETRALNYASTRDPNVLASYESALRDANAQITGLRALTSDNPPQQSIANSLQASSVEWRANMDRFVRSESRDTLLLPTPQFLKMVAGIRDMQDAESKLLAQRSSETATNLQNIRSGLVLFVLGNIGFLIFAAYMLLRAERQRERDQESRLRLAAIVDTSDDAIISKTLDGILTSWNCAAEHLYGYASAEVIGESIDIIVPEEKREEMRTILDTIRRGSHVDHLETIRVTRDGTRLTVALTVSPLKDEAGKVIGAAAIARDVTDRKRMEESLRELSARILAAEDEERRRIARDLHDTTVQELALVSMSLAQLKSMSDREKLESTLSQAHDLTNQCVQELRTLSYLLHPPMLDELGLASALKIYAEGFSKRSGVELDIEVSPRWKRLGHDTEIALFRVAQESLGNVVRHSGSPRATIKLDRNGEIKMDVIDQGRGLAENGNGDPTLGVGILGMRERIKHLGGSLTIKSGPTGTSVEARLPERMDG